MSKTLIIVESPSKSRKIEKYLGKDYLVRASYGHVFELKCSTDKKLGVDIENGFLPIYSVIPDKKDKIKAILDAAGQVDQILLAPDSDREGEAIGWHLAEVLGNSKLISRVIFNEITPKGIKYGVEHPVKLNQNIYNAQQARRIVDRLVGYLASPFLIKAFGPNMSCGRVQSPITRLIVEKERQIENFIPEEYWPINAVLCKPNDSENSFIARYQIKITNQKDAEKIKNELSKDTFKVIEVISDEKSKYPLPPLITSSLLQVAAKKFGLSSARITKAAQTLYESGYVTYIRTDSVRCDPNFIVDIRKWVGENGHELPTNQVEYKNKDLSQDAHEAIRPADVNKKAATLMVTDDEKKIYGLIWERSIAAQMKPAVYSTVSVTIQSSSGHILKANGRVLKYKGWLSLSGDVLGKKDEDNEINLPELNVNDELILTAPKVKIEQKFTKPPTRYKEHSLIKEMEDLGIGRPATYSSTLSKLTERNYVEKRKDVYYATDIGKKIVDELKLHFDFMKYEYTADMELQLDKIANGDLSYIDMMESFFPPFRDQLQRAIQANEKDYGIVCELCGKSMNLRFGRFGYFMMCRDYPTLCKNTKSCEMIDDKPVLQDTRENVVDGVECPKCFSPMRIKDGKFGKFYSCVKYPVCTGNGKLPFGKKCTDCGNELYITVLNNISKLACMGYPNCRHVEDLPENTKLNWIDPKLIVSNKKNDPVQKIINLSRKVM